MTRKEGFSVETRSKMLTLLVYSNKIKFPTSLDSSSPMIHGIFIESFVTHACNTQTGPAVLW